MSHPIHGSGGLKGIQLDAHSCSTQDASEPSGQLGRWSVSVAPGQAVLGGRRNQVRAVNKALIDRNITVLTNYNSHLLNRGAGGVAANAQQAKALRHEVGQLSKQVKNYVETLKSFNAAANNVERLRSKLGWDAPATRANGLVTAEKQLATAESKLQKQEEGLLAAQNALDGNIQNASGNKSILNGLFTPSKPGMFHKDDRAVLETRLSGLDSLEQSLLSRFSSATAQANEGNEAAGLEVHRISQQLNELSDSRDTLILRLQSDKGFHSSDAQPTPESNLARKNLAQVQSDFNVRLHELGGARRQLDSIILSGAPPSDIGRQKAEEVLRALEQKVENLADGLKVAEANYSAALKNDRKHDKANRKSEDRFRAILNAAQEKLPARKRKAAYQAQQQPVAPPRRSRPDQKAAGTPPQQSPAVPPRQRQAQRPGGAAAQPPPVVPRQQPQVQPPRPKPRTVRTSIGDLANAARQMKTLDDVRQLKERVVKLSGMTKVESLTIGQLMNKRIAEMMKDVTLARQANMSFIETHVQGRAAQESVNRIRLDTISKSLDL